MWRTLVSATLPQSLLSRAQAARAGLGGLLLVVCTLDVWWILRDRSPMPIPDCYIFLTRLLRFADKLGSDLLSILSWEEASSLLELLSHAGRPPLYQLLTLPLLLLGRSEDVLVMVNIPLLAVLVMATYKIGHLVSDNRVGGLVAATLVVGYSPVLQLSRTYLPHFAMIPAFAVSTWMLLRLANTRTVTDAWLFSGSLAIYALIHPHFFWLMAVPAVLLSGYLVFFGSPPRAPAERREVGPWLINKLRQPFFLRGLLPGGLLAIAMTLFWYLNWGEALVEAQKKFFSPELTAYRGYEIKKSGFTHLPGDIWWYARSAPGVMSWPLAIGALCGFLHGLWKRGHGTALLAVLMVTAYATQSQQANLAWWQMAAVLPAAAALTAAWITSLRSQRLSFILAVAFVLVAGFNVALQTFPLGPSSTHFARVLASPANEKTCNSRYALALCATPPAEEPWPLEPALERVTADPRCKDRRCRLMVIHYGRIWRPHFSFLMLSKWRRIPVSVASQGVPRLGAPYPLEHLLRSDYLLFVDVPMPANRKNYKAASTRFLQQPPELFAATHSTVATFKLPTGEPVRLIRRDEPLTATEAAEAIEAIELEARFKKSGPELIERLRAADEPAQASKARPEGTAP